MNERTQGSEAVAQHLDRIADLVRGRASHHGDAVEQHRRMSGLIESYLVGAHGAVLNLSAADAAHICLLLKVSRIEAAGLKSEHVEDIVGYAAIVLACMDADRSDLEEAAISATKDDLRRPDVAMAC